MQSQLRQQGRESDLGVTARRREGHRRRYAPKVKSQTQKRTQPGAVSDRLRLDILSGYYAPRQRLVEEAVANRYGVSRADVRVAFLELVTEGLVERLPNRGVCVRQVSIEEAIEIREVQLGVQAICAARAAELATDSEIAALKSTLANMTEAARNNDPIAYYQLLHKLHEEIRLFSRQPTAARVSQQLLDQVNQHRLIESFAPGRMMASLGEHARIVAAIEDRNSKSAEDGVRKLRISVVQACRDVVSRSRDPLGDSAASLDTRAVGSLNAR